MNSCDRKGEQLYNNFGSLMEIINYRSYTDIDVYFPEYDWTYYHGAYNAFVKGKMKCPYEPRMCGVGYLGEGIYKTSYNSIKSKAYLDWNHMLNRCYIFSKTLRLTYEDCFVCDDWLNYQNFAKWHDENYYEILGETMCLDKDILIKNNKIYSPDTCVFVPQKINTLFVKSNKIRGKFPIGVHIDRHGKYIAECKCNGEKQYIGYYTTIEEAFNAYKKFKEKYIKEVADEYKDLIPIKLYEAMYNYEVEITD